MSINTSTQLILLFGFALTLSQWALSTLLFMIFILIVINFYLKNNHFYRLMKRLKWFYFVMFIIFTFNTPGEHIPYWPLTISPTYEGIISGCKQVLRIAAVLGVLSIILFRNSKEKLISGLYFLLKPLTYIGIDTKRFSARLWLTLYYVDLRQEENQTISKAKDLSDSLEQILKEDTHKNVVIELSKPIVSTIDFIAIGCLLIGVMYAFWA